MDGPLVIDGALVMDGPLVDASNLLGLTLSQLRQKITDLASMCQVIGINGTLMKAVMRRATCWRMEFGGPIWKHGLAVSRA
eukprot:gene30308-37862_t